jgi:hypothetical protein
LEPPPLAQLREIAERAELGNDGLSRRAYDADPCVQPSRSSRGTDDTHMTPSPTSGGFPIGAIHVSQAAMDVCLVPTGALRHQRHALRHQRQHLPQQHLHQQLVAHRAVASVPTALTALARCLTPPDSSVVTQSSCAANLPRPTRRSPLLRWEEMPNNSFDFTQADVPGCHLSANSCRQNAALFSEYGSSPPLRGVGRSRQHIQQSAQRFQ